MTESIEDAAQRLWTATKRLDGKFEFCSILNETIRLDDPKRLEAAMGVIRCIKSKLVLRDNPSVDHFPPWGEDVQRSLHPNGAFGGVLSGAAEAQRRW